MNKFFVEIPPKIESKIKQSKKDFKQQYMQEYISILKETTFYININMALD